MARNLAYYMDPDEEERRREGQALIESELAMGPPPPPPNLGVAPVPRLPIDMTTPRRTDGDYSGFRDPYQDEEPTEEELAADEAHEGGEDGSLDVLLDHDPASGENPYDSYLPPTYGAGLGGYAGRLDMGSLARAELAAGARLETAPEPVDKTAASVSAEQKGVPAASPTAAQQRAMAIAEQPSPLPSDHTSEVQRVAAEPQKGQRSDFFGFDDEEGFSRQKQIERVRELYGQESEPTRFWEDEFLANHKGRSDADIDRAWLLQSLWSGNEHGMRFRQMLKNEQQGYEQGLSQARAQDVANQRISRGMAEAIAATGQISPEAAVKLRMNDKLVRDFGQFASQGGRAEGQQIGLSKEKLKILNGMANAKDKEEFDRWKAQLGSATQMAVAETYAGAKGRPNTPEALAAEDNAAASLMGQALGATPAVGARALQGDLSGLTAEQRADAERIAPQILHAKATGKLGQLTLDSLKPQVSGRIKNELAIEKSVEVMRRNPKSRSDFKTDWSDASLTLNGAWNAWQSLNEDDKARFAEWASGGWSGQVKDALTEVYGEGGAARVMAKYAQVKRYVNAIVKRLGGSAVTGSEWGRIADELGIARDDWSPFNTGDAITQHMMDSAKQLNAHHDIFVDEFGSWEAQ